MGFPSTQKLLLLLLGPYPLGLTITASTRRPCLPGSVCCLGRELFLLSQGWGA